MNFEHDEEADAAYITFLDEDITKTHSIGSEVNVDYCTHGIRGVEFLFVSFGIPVEPLERFLPRRLKEIVGILEENGLTVRKTE